MSAELRERRRAAAIERGLENRQPPSQLWRDESTLTPVLAKRQNRRRGAVERTILAFVALGPVTTRQATLHALKSHPSVSYGDCAQTLGHLCSQGKLVPQGGLLTVPY